MPNVELNGEPGTGVAEDIIARLLPEWWSRFQPKNKAYGGALATGGGLGIKAFIPEINRKVGGIVNEIWHGEPPQKGAEDAREKAMDLIGHLFILISNLDSRMDGGPRVGLDINAVMDRAMGASKAARLAGGDGKAAGLAKVDELTAVKPQGFPTEADLRAQRWSANEPEVTSKRCPARPGHQSHTWSGTSAATGLHEYWCSGLVPHF